MKILPTEREMVRDVAERWKRQYCNFGEWGTTMHGSCLETHKKLCALDVETATSADVDAIIGTSGWTQHWCFECLEYKQPAVQFGSDYDSVTVCLDCLRVALKQARAADAVARGSEATTS